MFIKLIMLSVTISVVLASDQGLSAADTKYNMQDLRVLKSQESYKEFFQHALDIRPSKRDQEWSKMAEQMGISWLNELLKKPELTSEDYELVKKISQWPLFREDEFFQERRDAYFIRQLKLCKTNCLEKGKKLYSDYQHGLNFKFDFIAALYPQHLTIQKVWTYTAPIVESKFGEFYCHKSPLDQIILSRLITHKETSIHQDCLKSLAPKVIENYLAADPKHSSDMYELIKKLGISAPTLELYQQTLHFLRGHMKDLSPLKVLANSEAKRNELLKKFKDSPYLPDDIFQTNNQKQSQSYLRILSRHFPEYLNLYARTCLDYLSGDKEFPRGNPTPQCHDLFELSQKMNLFPIGFESRYKKYTQFMRQ